MWACKTLLCWAVLGLVVAPSLLIAPTQASNHSDHDDEHGVHGAELIIEQCYAERWEGHPCVGELDYEHVEHILSVLGLIDDHDHEEHEEESSHEHESEEEESSSHEGEEEHECFSVHEVYEVLGLPSNATLDEDAIFPMSASLVHALFTSTCLEAQENITDIVGGLLAAVEGPTAEGLSREGLTRIYSALRLSATKPFGTVDSHDDHEHEEEEESSHEHEEEEESSSHEGEEEEESSHEHGHEGEEEHEEHLVCPTVDAVFAHLNLTGTQLIEADEVGDISALLVSMMLTPECRQPVAANPDQYAAALFTEFGTGGYMTTAQLGTLMSAINVAAETITVVEAPQEHAHAHRRSIERRSVGTCPSAASLLATFGFRSPLSMAEFDRIATALVQLQEQGTCGSSTNTIQASTSQSRAEKWGYGFLATAIICLGSLVGFAFLPYLRADDDDVYNVMSSHHAGRSSNKLHVGFLSFTLALAVGTLVGDALLHLAPIALEVSAFSENGGEDWGYLKRSIGTVFAILLFYLIQVGASRFFSSRTTHGPSNTSRDVPLRLESSPGTSIPSKDAPVRLESFDVGREYLDVKPRGPVQHVDTEEDSIKSSTAWLIIIGDGLHNFVDGLTIGAAFSISNTVGISTSIAIFCHEVPHEIGDLVVFLDAGWSIRNALLYNLASALTAFLGLIITLGADTTDSFNRWVLSFTLGMFLYVALTDLVPELMHLLAAHTLTAGKWARLLLIQCLGWIAGFVIMILLARYEADIQV